jgi:hypothetical protein
MPDDWSENEAPHPETIQELIDRLEAGDFPGPGDEEREFDLHAAHRSKTGP